MSHMLKSHLVVQNAAAVAKWYPEVLSATAAQPMAALRFTSRQRAQRDQPITCRLWRWSTPNSASAGAMWGVPVVSSLSSDPTYGSGSAGLAADQNRRQGECSVPGQMRSYASSSARVDSNYFCASRRL